MIKAKHISHICSTVKNRAIFNKSSNTEEGSSSLFIPCNKGLARSKEVDKKLGRSLLIVQEIRTFLPHKLSSSKSRHASLVLSPAPLLLISTEPPLHFHRSSSLPQRRLTVFLVSPHLSSSPIHRPPQSLTRLKYRKYFNFNSHSWNPRRKTASTTVVME